MDDATRAAWREKIEDCFTLEYGVNQYGTPDSTTVVCNTARLDALLAEIDHEARADAAPKVGQRQDAASGTTTQRTVLCACTHDAGQHDPAGRCRCACRTFTPTTLRTTSERPYTEEDR